MLWPGASQDWKDPRSSTQPSGGGTWNAENKLRIPGCLWFLLHLAIFIFIFFYQFGKNKKSYQATSWTAGASLLTPLSVGTNTIEIKKCKSHPYWLSAQSTSQFRFEAKVCDLAVFLNSSSCCDTCTTLIQRYLCWKKKFDETPQNRLLKKDINWYFVFPSDELKYLQRCPFLKIV